MNTYMDKTELAIAKIRSADKIKIYKMPNGIMGLLIISGKSFFNYSADEKYFRQLEAMAVRLYSVCPYAAVDEFTAKILEKRAAAELSSWRLFYKVLKVSDDKKKPSDKYTVKSFKQIIEYYLEMIYDKIGCKAQFPAELNGYKRRFCLLFRLNDQKKAVPFSFDMINGRCKMFFGNVIDAVDSIKLTIEFDFGKIRVNADVRSKKELRIENIIDIIGGEEKLRIFDDAEVVFSKISDMSVAESCLPTKLCSISEINACKCVALPWGAAYLYAADDTIEILTMLGSDFVHHSAQTYSAADRRIITDSMSAVHEFFGENEICTHFLPLYTYSDGKYKKELENRYFYGIAEDMGAE